MEFEVRVAGEQRTVAVERVDGGWKVQVGEGEARVIPGRKIGVGEWAMRLAPDRRRVAGVHVDGERVDLHLGGRDWRAEVIDARKAALQLGSGGQEGAVVSQMPGVIVRTLVAVGDSVESGQPVIVVEAMKMENEFKAPVAGTVSSVDVENGQAIDAGTTLLVIDPAE